MKGIRVRTAVLVSGRGSNLKSLIAACSTAAFPAEIVLVISNNPAAEALNHAQSAGIRTKLIPHNEFAGRDEFEVALDSALHDANAELICLAGFMRILSEALVRKWEGRMINIHPSLLPSFKGSRVHERVIEAGVRISGCTVHYVTPETDSGPPIAQAAVAVHAGDTPETLAARVLDAEHQLFPLALRMVAEGRVRLENGKATFADYRCPSEFLINPAEA